MDKFMEIAAKFGANKYMTAVRDGFASTMPLIMAGAITVMINNVFFVPWSLVAGFIGGDHPFITWGYQYLSPLFGAVEAGSLNLTALGVALGIAYIRATDEGVDPLSTVLITLGAFFILQPFSRVSDVAGHLTNYYGAMGILVGLFTGLIASAIFIAVVKRGYVITMPDMVPPAVGRAFAAIIPGFVALMAFAFVPYFFSLAHTFGWIAEGGSVNIFEWVEATISSRLMSIFGGTDTDSFLPGLIGAVVIKFIQELLWLVGLHGPNLTAPVTSPIWGVFDTMNVTAFANHGKDAVLFPWTGTSGVIYANLGGSGATMGWLIAVFMFNKRPDAKEIANIALAPGIFEINEPIVFGVPMVLNPIYMFPFLLTTPLLTAFAYTLTWVGFAGRVVNSIPWTTPPILGAAMATNFDIGAIITSVLCLVIATAMYAPFVILSNKEFEKQTEEA